MSRSQDRKKTASNKNSPARPVAASSSTCHSPNQENSNNTPARNRQGNSRNLLTTTHRTIRHPALTRTSPEGRKTRERTRTKKARPLVPNRMSSKKKETALLSVAVRESDFSNLA